eukprot:TRINITY_DN67252_c2_g1_i2.p2 TRINITY_DN67252_c2_g1~~TRINITY_DN67252_c2_g1_i2.p2  ORF type:complete len:114 (+),score=31.87 TRINITY_DN67252_c2_g1_i2:205-546(+)
MSRCHSKAGAGQPAPAPMQASRRPSLLPVAVFGGICLASSAAAWMAFTSGSTRSGEMASHSPTAASSASWGAASTAALADDMEDAFEAPGIVIAAATVIAALVLRLEAAAAEG